MTTRSKRSRPRWRQVGALISMLLFSVSLWSPPASSAEKSKREVAGTSVEAWYHVFDDQTEDPMPVPTVPDPVNPYGDDTLHVGITAGQEDARTYVGLDLSDLSTTFDLVEATLVLPIDPDAATMKPDDARVHACLSDLPAKSTEGSFDEPPDIDCKTQSPATYIEKPFPHLIVDITPFGDDLTHSGIALTPSSRAKEQGDTWHVAFYAKKNDAKPAKPIKAELHFVPADTTAPTSEEPAEVDPGVQAGGFGDVSTGGGGFGVSTAPDPSVEEPIAEADEDTVAATPVEAAAEQPATQPTSARQAAYTIVWSLPLVFLALAFYFGSALTREVVLRRDAQL